MKKDDIVTIKDGSYTRSVVDGKLVSESLAYGDEKGKQYVVIEIDCRFPAERIQARFNNTVIQAIDSGKVVFIEERFLRPVLPTHTVMVDIVQEAACWSFGKIVEVSDKLYREITK